MVIKTDYLRLFYKTGHFTCCFFATDYKTLKVFLSFYTNDKFPHHQQQLILASFCMNVNIFSFVEKQ